MHALRSAECRGRSSTPSASRTGSWRSTKATGTVRSLFAFDPNRRAVILLGGDKRGDWSGWYERNVPLADDLYDAYLREET